MSEPYKDWIVRFYASHNDISEGHADGEIVGELIRCKDCKFSSPNRVYGCRLYNGKIDERMYADDYCSQAERKEE